MMLKLLEEKSLRKPTLRSYLLSCLLSIDLKDRRSSRNLRSRFEPSKMERRMSGLLSRIRDIEEKIILLKSIGKSTTLMHTVAFFQKYKNAFSIIFSPHYKQDKNTGVAGFISCVAWPLRWRPGCAGWKRRRTTLRITWCGCLSFVNLQVRVLFTGVPTERYESIM